MMATRRDFVMHVPTRSPMGDIASSAPREKNVMPTTSMTAPKRNAVSTLVGSGVMVKLSSSTMHKMGATADRDSFSFSCRWLRYKMGAPFRSWI